MTDEKWAAAWALFNEARELPLERRSGFVENASADPEVTRKVLELLLEEDAGAVPPAPRAGSRVGRYTVIDQLGRGGMGEVYSARDTELDRTVALKFLAPELDGGPHLAERFIREAKAASALNHPNIVTVYEVVQSHSGRAIAMELVEGRSLRELGGGIRPASQVMGWGRQIAQALAVAHAQGIVHRDIKPENVMVRPDGYVKVLDFGLARRVSAGAGRTSVSGLFGGTLNYMSPEQTRGEGATAASDVFSLGLVLFELAAGRHPFLADSPIDTAHAIAHAEPKIPSTIPEPLAAAIAAMLAKDPRKRPAAAEVERRLGESGVRPRRRAFSWVAAAAAPLAVTAAAWIWTSAPESRPRPETLRQITAQASENRVIAAAISPDGATLAFVGLGEAIQLRRMSDGLSRALSTLPGMQVQRIAWFGDGSRLLVTGQTDKAARPGIWIVPVSRGLPARQVVPAGEDGVPSPDGRRIAFTSGNGATIWIADTEGNGAPKQVRGGASTTVFSSLVWSPDSRRISYQRQEFAPPRNRQVQGEASMLEMNHEYRFESTEADTGRVAASANDFVMTSACSLPDGRILFLRWPSYAHTLSRQLWELPTDPRSGAILGRPTRLSGVDPEMLSSISATSDGSRIVMVRSRGMDNVYVADLPALSNAAPKLLHVRRLTFTLMADYPHAWTPDSRAVIFESSRNGRYDLFRQNLDRTEAEPLVVSAADKVLPQVTPDGKWVLYRDGGGGVHTIMRVPIAGDGTPEPVPAGAHPGEFRCGLQPGSRCVMRIVENDQFVFYELDAIRGKGRDLSRTMWSPTVTGDWDISPDGMTVAIPNHDSLTGKVRMVRLDGPRSDLPEKTVTLEVLKGLNGLVWTADGKGWYVCVRAPAGFVLSQADLEGRSRELLKIPGTSYAVPSPDRRRIAFPQTTVSSNVWALAGETGAGGQWRFVQ
jgi:Tol biopolymer transport system component